MAAKKPKYIPLERLMVTGEPGDYERNLGIERKRLVDALEAEQISNARENLTHKDRQRAKAKQPRTKSEGDDGRPKTEVVADVVNRPEFKGWKPDDLLQHVHAAIKANDMEPVKDKWAKELIRRARRKPSGQR